MTGTRKAVCPAFFVALRCRDSSIGRSLTVQLRQRTEEMKDECAAARRRVEILGETLETHLALLEAGDGFNEVLEGSAKAV